VEYIRTLDVTFDVGDTAELSVESRSGTVAIRGDGGNNVRVEVVARLWADDDDEADDQAELIRRGISQDGQRVYVKAPSLLRPKPILFFGHGGPRVDYQITVPKKTAARIDSRSGRVEVSDMVGPLGVQSRSGKTAVRGVERDVQVVSRSGSVLAESIGGTLDAESRSGSIRAKGCAGDATLHARSGSLTIEDVRGRLKAGTRSGSVRYEGPVLGSFDIDVTSGSVRLSLDPESRFFLDAEAVSGSVTSDFRVREGSGGAPREGVPTLRIRTASGSIYIGSS